jgi:hypothetical protein
MKRDEIEPYGTLREIAPGLVCLDGRWKRTPFGRRMTVIRLGGGGLLVHNAIRLREEDYGALDALGEVQIIVAPNKMHSSEAHVYKLRYPEARLYASRASAGAIAGRCPVDGALPGDWDPSLDQEVGCFEFGGTRMLHESVFFHRASRTLVLTDLVFNLQDDVQGATRWFFRVNRIHKRFGPSRIFRHVFVRDREAARASFRRLMEWDFDRVIMSHGEILASGGKAAMQRGFEEMGLA